MAITPKLQDDVLASGQTARKYTIADAGSGKSTITEDLTVLETQGTVTTAALLKNIGLVRVTCTTAGTAHALTSENTGLNQISFVADAAYSTGNTVTLNGSTLTVKGTPLFKSGDTVFALLDGTTINFTRYPVIDTGDNFTTTESVIGKWTDNKPLYRKVTTIAALPNTGIGTYPHSITNVDFIALQAPSGIIEASGKYYSVLQYLSGIRYEVDKTNILFNTAGGNYSTFKGLVTLIYTKTTD